MGATNKSGMPDLNNFTPQLTADGSFTFFSKEFGESFHSHHGARQESFLKFVKPAQLTFKAKKSVLRLLDVCYGLGYNTAAALQSIWAVNPNCRVELIALEINPDVPQAAIAHRLFDDWNYQHTEILARLAYQHQVQTNNLQARIIIGDARTAIAKVSQSGFQADVIFLDPFSPPQCPHLWTVEFIQQLAMCLHEEGLLVTYSCAAAVRAALLSANLHIFSTPPVGRRSPGTVAARHPIAKDRFQRFSCFDTTETSEHPYYSLSQAEKEHLQTRAAIPYRDPQLKDPPEVILKRRQEEQKTSCLEPTSRWRKRWLARIKDSS